LKRFNLKRQDEPRPKGVDYLNRKGTARKLRRNHETLPSEMKEESDSNNSYSKRTSTKCVI